MNKVSTLKRPLAISFALHAAVIGGAITYDEYSKYPEPGLGQPHSDTITIAPPTAVERRAAIMSMYNAELFIPLEGFINKESAEMFARNYQNANLGFADDYFVTVSTNSAGGNVHAGYMIANEINSSPIPTRILCTEQAASMAAMILITTANAFTRDATNNCTLMLHAPYDMYTVSDQTITLNSRDYAIAQSLFNEDPDLQYWNFLYSARNEEGQYEEKYLIFSREQVSLYSSNLETMAAKFARSIAEHSHLSEQDVTLLFEKGDIHFNAFEALYLGLIDHIEGAQMDEINALTTALSVCAAHPEIGLCDTNALPQPEF